MENNIVCQSKCTVLGQGSVCGIDLNEFKSEKFDSGNKFSCREKLGIKPDDYVVLYVGRPYKRKGFHSLLRAWGLMQPKGNLLLMAGCSQQDVLKVAELTYSPVTAKSLEDALQKLESGEVDAICHTGATIPGQLQTSQSPLTVISLPDSIIEKLTRQRSYYHKLHYIR